MSCGPARPKAAKASLVTRVVLGLLLFGMSLVQTDGAEAEERVFRVTLSGGSAPEGAPTFRVREGDSVTLEITSDRALEVHLHGYDLQLRLQPGKEASLRLEARHSGRFPAEGHGAAATVPLFYLEVLP